MNVLKCIKPVGESELLTYNFEVGEFYHAVDRKSRLGKTYTKVWSNKTDYSECFWNPYEFFEAIGSYEVDMFSNSENDRRFKEIVDSNTEKRS
jgi:hypothetical protein